MSQDCHFSQLKVFSEEFTKNCQYSEILEMIKKILEKETEIDEKLVNKISETIETKILILSANEPKIEKFLTTGDSKILLHPQSRSYFVNEELWKVLEEEIFKKFKDIKKKDDFLNLAKDYAELEQVYQRKMLIFEAS